MKKLTFFSMIIIFCSFSLFSNDELTPIVENNLLGYINYEGNIEITPQYKFHKIYKETKINGKIYRIPQLEEEYFSEDKHCIQKMKLYLWGLIKIPQDYAIINQENSVLIDDLDRGYMSYHEGLAKVEIMESYIYNDSDPEYGFVNERGHPAFPINIQSKDAEETMILNKDVRPNTSPVVTAKMIPTGIQIISKTGRKNKEENTITVLKGLNYYTPFLSIATNFIDGYALVMSKDYKAGEDNYFFINTNGINQFQTRYTWASKFSDGMANVKLNDKKFYIDTNGKKVFEYKYAKAYDFSNGYARFYQDGVFGFINKKGKEISKQRWLESGDFHDSLAFVMIDDYFGYIDKDGNTVIDAKYMYARDFSEGLALVKNQMNKWEYIDKDGKSVISADIIYGQPFRNGLALIINSDGMGQYINHKGEIVYEFPKRFGAKQ